MNLLLFRAEERSEKALIEFCDHRAKHLRDVLGVKPGQSLRAGEINGDIGLARVEEVNNQLVRLSWEPTHHPPPALPCTLILALPRPKMLSRILQSVTSMGVKEIHIVNTWKVDKSYWKSPKLSSAAIESELLLGLSQAGDTIMPLVSLHPLFRPFAEDLLPSVCRDRSALVAHPYATQSCPVNIDSASVLAIGPEGGFTEFELELAEKAGMVPVSIGDRILRVETAVPALLSRLYPA